MSVSLSMRGVLDEADRYAQEMIRRATASGQPAIISSAVIVAASNHLWMPQGPDFESLYDILARHGTSDFRDSAIATMWYDLPWGAALLGLLKPPVGPLASAVRLADRYSAPHALDLALRLLATALAEDVRVDDAILLAACSDTNLRRYRTEVARAWVQSALDRAIGTTSNRAVHEEAAHNVARHQRMALVNQLDAISHSAV
jgi:hypothetical protein